MISSKFAGMLAKNRDMTKPDFFKEIAIAYRRFDHIITMLNDYIKPDFRILDIGCHIGILLYLIKMKYPKVKAEGFNEIDCFIQNERLDKDVKLYKQDLYDSNPKPDFDLVLMTEVLEHVGNPEKAFEIASGFSKKYLFVSLPINNIHGNYISNDEINEWGKEYMDNIEWLPNCSSWRFCMCRKDKL